MKTKKVNFWLPAIFLIIVLFLLIIPLSAFLVSEIFGWKEGIYDVLKDFGSLIAGVIAVIGVAWMVYAQKIETERIIKSNDDVMKSEAFEMQRIKALEHAFSISRKLDELRGGSSMNYISDFYRWVCESHGSNYFEDIKSEIYFIRDFLYGHKEGILALGAIQDFIVLYEDPRWKQDTANIGPADLFMLADKLRIIGRNRVDSENYLIYDPYFRMKLDTDADNYAMRLRDNHFTFNFENPIAYIIRLATPSLILAIKTMKIKED